MTKQPDRFPLLAAAATKALAAGACVAAAYGVGIWVASMTQSAIGPFWPASGVAVGAVLLWGWPTLPGIYAAVVAANLFSGFGGPFAWIGPVGFIAEAALGAAIVRWLIGGRKRLDDLRGILAIVLGAAWLPPLCNALLFGRVMPMSDGSPLLSGADDIVRFVLAHGFGIALITPAMLVWWTAPLKGWWPRFLLATAATLLAVWLTFAVGQPAFLLLVPVIGAAVATGLRGASIISAATALVIVVCTGAGVGPLAAAQAPDYARVYAMLAVLAFGVLPVGAVSGEYRRNLRQRRAAEQATGLRFWEWNDTDGLRFKGGETPPKLFDAAQERGSLETTLDGRDALSFWQVVSRRSDGAPREVAGMLIDASGRLQMEKTRRLAWQSEIELRNLRASLTPHLLFNCLAAVRGIVRTDPEKARTFIDTLSRFLRDSNEAQNRRTVPLHDEWQLCEDFLALQSLRYEREIPRLVEIEGPAHHARVPPMMLLNLVENAVKHGEVSQRHPMVVRASLHDGRLSAEVRNHGRLGPPTEGRTGGVGTANARLQAIYGADSSLAVRQEGEEVAARLELPAEAPGGETGES